MEYKVWVCVEQHDPDTDSYQDCDLPFAGVETFDDLETATQFAQVVQFYAERLASLLDNALNENDPDKSQYRNELEGVA